MPLTRREGPLGAAPRLRTDLIVSRQETAGGTVFVIKDPVSGGFFRVGEMERFIAEQLDGETGLDVVRQRTEARFAGSLPRGSLDAFVQRLERAHLLETGDSATRKSSRRRRGFRGSLLYLRLPLLDPDRILDRLVHRVRLCFTTPFLVFSTAVILVAAGITIANWGALAQDSARLYKLGAIPLLLAVAFVVGSAHEFAHGLTCKHFGGKVPDMGFMLLYFQPALYTNVSDAWLFPEKAKRLWVSLAGPYFELFLWGLATLAWRVAEADTAISHMAVTVMAVSGIRCLLNFNPFIKLDGYYLLSDYLDIPNLRRKSFAYVGGAIRRLFGVGTGIAAAVTRRERRVYLGYGAVATVFSVALLAYVFVTAGAFFIEIRQPTALALLTGLVGIKSRRRFRNLFRPATAPDPSDPAPSEQAPSEPAQPVEAADAPKKSRRHHRGRSTRRAVWAALAAVLAVVLLGRMQLRIGGPFVVLPEENADVRAEVDGIIKHIAVDEGDSVRAGDVIARLSNHPLEAELPKTQAAIRETRALMKKLEAGPTAQEVALAQASVARVEDRLRYARTNATRLTSLYATGAVTRQELEAGQELVTTAENDLAEARGRVEALLVRTRPEDIEAMRARLASLEAQQRFLTGEVRELTVLSPVSGIVATPSRQLKELKGQLVGRGLLIAKVYDFGAVMAQLVVSEKDIADVQVGQPVVLRVRAHPNTVFHGTVTAIAAAAEGTPTATAQVPLSDPAGGGGTIPGRAFIVTTRIDNHDRLLKPGMTGHAKVLGGQRRIVDLITRRLARTLKVEVWSWW